MTPRAPAGRAARHVRFVGGHGRAGRRGFTLIELLVSLIAGMLVALAVVGLSRTATLTFHEEARAATAEMGLRMAAERLRSDLQRAGFMSTGNGRWDPMVASQRGQIPLSGYATDGLRNLQSLYYVPDGSKNDTEAGGLALATTNGLAPDRLDITGNFTGTDEFLGTVAPGQSSCTGPRVMLSLDDPAVLRIVRKPDGSANPQGEALLAETFQPVAGKTFLARISDVQGCAHFAPVCATGVNAGIPYVDLRGVDAVLTSSQTGGRCGVNGFETIAISPIQTVRWSVTRRPSLADPTTQPERKFDLVRQLVDETGAGVGEPEVVAEYAIDFEIAFVVDAAGVMTVLPFGAPSNADWAGVKVGATASSALGPHRVRAVRYRMATRSPLPDRTNPLPAPAGYLYRYCTDPDASGCLKYARVRTVQGEVGLPNQARMTY